jgi:hypothetical protein
MTITLPADTNDSANSAYIALAERPKALMTSMGLSPTSADAELEATAKALGLTVMQYMTIKPLVKQWLAIRDNFSHLQSRVAQIISCHRDYIPFVPIWEEDLQYRCVSSRFLWLFETKSKEPMLDIESLPHVLKLAAQVIDQSLTGEVRLKPVVVEFDQVVVDGSERQFLTGPWRRRGLYSRWEPSYVLCGEVVVNGQQDPYWNYDLAVQD